MPKKWARVDNWLNFKEVPSGKQFVDNSVMKLKNPEIPKLESYEENPSKEFWTKFPKCELPNSVVTGLKPDSLMKEMSKVENKLTLAQKKRAKRCIMNLKHGAGACQKNPALPMLYTRNAKLAFRYGREVTDAVATFVKKGFVSGPWDSPPLPKFRVNPLMAVPQGAKCRPVLNVSLPEGKSFNDNINDNLLEKVKMSSARKFGFTVKESGKDAWMLKFDLTDAYKNVPAKLEDLRLQGFSWLGKFFVENRQIFGARTAVANFDILGKTILDIVCADCEIAKQKVHRQLDDVPVVGKREECVEFERKYREVCKAINIGLAENCEKFDKAFGLTQYGKVLGIWFDSEKKCWKLPHEKAEKAADAISEAMKEEMDLLKMQKLMGRLNDICLMCPFLSGFKKPLNSALGFLQKNPNKKIQLTREAREDLMIFAGFLKDNETWCPIPDRPCFPPVWREVYTSDAAGCAKVIKDGEEIGCGNVGLDMEGKILFASQIFWPKETLCERFDEKGARYGAKTTTLEFLGMMLPFLQTPEKMRNKHIVLMVDNISCIFGWQNKAATHDNAASILIRSLHLLSAFLECKIDVVHLPRMSTWEAELVDRLSRKSSTTSEDRRLIQSFNLKRLPECIECWMKNPYEDFILAKKVLEEVKDRIRE